MKILMRLARKQTARKKQSGQNISESYFWSNFVSWNNTVKHKKIIINDT